MLRPGLWSTLRWTRVGSETGSIRVECLGNCGGIDDPIPAKPKGMHRATNGKLVAEYQPLTAIWWKGIGARAPELLP